MYSFCRASDLFFLTLQDDDDGHLAALQCVSELMVKCQSEFTDHMARLGVVERVTQIAGPPPQEETEEKTEEKTEEQPAAPPAPPPPPPPPSPPAADAKEIRPGKPYHWHDWNAVRGRDCLYLWNEWCAIELSNGSNGWFRFLIDGRLATMYSSGSPEGGSEPGDGCPEFVDKLHRARSFAPDSLSSEPILSSPDDKFKLIVGNWSLICCNDNEVAIHNSDGHQATILRDDLSGFVFESNRGTRQTYSADSPLGSEFAAIGSGKRSGKKLQSKSEALKEKVRTLAREITDKYLSTTSATSRRVMAELQDVVRRIMDAQYKDKDEELREALGDLASMLRDEKTVSPYEVQASGLVSVLLKVLSPSGKMDMNRPGGQNAVNRKRALFMSAFSREESKEREQSRYVITRRFSVLMVIFMLSAKMDSCCLKNMFT